MNRLPFVTQPAILLVSQTMFISLLVNQGEGEGGTVLHISGKIYF